MKKIFKIITMLLVLFCNTNLFAQLSFSAKTDFNIGVSPNAITHADINGDGLQDIIATRQTFPKKVSVILNTTTIGASSPTFSSATDFTVEGANDSKIAAADFNGDGKPDIVASESFESTVRVLINTTTNGASTPTFSAYTSFTTGKDPIDVSVGDINGDGKPDIITANFSASTVSVLLNTTSNGASTPTFSSKSDFSVATNPYRVAIGDFNGDGKSDIIAQSSNINSSISVLLNTTSNGASTPSFSTKTDFTVGATRNNNYSVAIGDINGDDKPDIISANFTASIISVLLNTTSIGASSPTFSGKTDFTVGTSPDWITIADFDGDGKPDVVTSNGANTVSVLINTTANGAATPTFTSKADFGVGASPSSVINADINGDNKPDIITSNSPNASVLLNTTTFPASINWNGNVSSNWNTAGNWDLNTVPIFTDNVVIPNVATNDPIISTTAAVCNMITISWGGSLTIAPGNDLTINGNLTNNGTFTINSDTSTSGSLILEGSATGNITYNRYLSINKWHLISAPVGGQNIENLVTLTANHVATNGVNYGLAPYVNTLVVNVSTWNHWTSDGTNPVNTAGNFVAGKGYEVYTATTAGTIAFTGTIPESQVVIAVTGTTNRWNLVGNPYPASIPANLNADAKNNFLTDNSAALDPSFVSLYIWNPDTSLYEIVNQSTSSRFIAPVQGFFIKAVTGEAGIVNFTTAMRTNQAAVAFQKTATPNIPSIVLSAENNSGKISTTDLKYLGGMSLGLDPGYDAGRFGAANSSFGLYTHLVTDNGVDFAIQAVPENSYDTTVIPIGLDANIGTQVTFKATITNLPLGKKVFLEDRLLNLFTELNNTDKTYTLTLDSQSSGIGRFFLHTQDNLSTLAVADVNKLKFSVIALPLSNQLKLIGMVDEPASLNIYDTLGRAIFYTNLSASNNYEVTIPPLAYGVYIIKVKTAKSNFSTKIAWY